MSRFSPDVRQFLESLPPRERVALIVGVHVGQTGSLPPKAQIVAIRRQFNLNAEPKPWMPAPPKPVAPIVCKSCGATEERPDGSVGRPPQYCSTCRPRKRD